MVNEKFTLIKITKPKMVSSIKTNFYTLELTAMKKLYELTGVRMLSKDQQKSIVGGYGCPVGGSCPPGTRCCTKGEFAGLCRPNGTSCL